MKKTVLPVIMALTAAGTLGHATQAAAHTVPAPNPLYGDGGVSDFYHWKKKIPAKAGTMLRTEDLGSEGYAHASKVQRILYTSTDGADGKTPVTVSGLLLLPKGTPPEGGWPLITWGHGTTGVADVCAPSWMLGGRKPEISLDGWLEAGFAVVATDYQGLGTPGPHPYLYYKSEGYSVLDAARAALAANKGLIANKVVSAGFSQGSEASLGAAWLAPTYAPDLNVVSGIGTGVVARIADKRGAKQIEEPLLTDEPGEGEAAFRILFLIGTGPALLPGFKPEVYALPAAQPLIRAGQTGCTMSIFGKAFEMKATFYPEPGKMLIYTPEFDAEVDRIEAARWIPNGHFKMPIMTTTGLADNAAHTSWQYNFVSVACRSGTKVEWKYYPGQTHGSAVVKSLPDMIDFAKRTVAGEPVTGNCPALVEPGPIQAPAEDAKGFF